jgi:hypothetical protein
MDIAEISRLPLKVLGQLLRRHPGGTNASADHPEKPL